VSVSWCVGWQLTVCKALKLCKQSVLLGCFDVLHNSKQYSKRAITSLVLHALTLLGVLAYVIVEGVGVLTLEEGLAN
jgi:hypothetical protein